MATEYGTLLNAVKEFHDEIVSAGRPNHGHGWDHDTMVAQYALLIADEPRVGEMAWVAGLLHSLDRHLQSETATNAQVAEFLVLLPSGSFSTNEQLQIMKAIKEHSKRNSDEDGPVTIALKDADRLANIGPINLFRGGQHRPNIPACIPQYLDRMHPRSTFREPACCLDGTRYNLEWEEMLRLPKAKVLGKPYFEYYREFHKLAIHQMEEIGLFPWPL